MKGVFDVAGESLGFAGFEGFFAFFMEIAGYMPPLLRREAVFGFDVIRRGHLDLPERNNFAVVKNADVLAF